MGIPIPMGFPGNFHGNGITWEFPFPWDSPGISMRMGIVLGY